MKNLTAIYWIKNEARYLPEYIEFHLLQGFDYFIFYDNDSTDNTLEILQPYVDAGLAEIRYYPEEVKRSGVSKNYWVMSHCIDEQKHKTKWLHFHAIDEFLFCKNGMKLPQFLKQYEFFGGLAVNWKLFNSDNHIKTPQGLTFENFKTYVKYDVNLHVKTLIQPLLTRSPAPNTHWFYTNATCDENGRLVVGPFNTEFCSQNISLYPNVKKFPEHYTFNKIQLNHYVTRSKEQWDESNSKGLLDHGRQSEERTRERENLWNSLHNINNQNNSGLNIPHDHFPGFEVSNELDEYVEIVRNNILQRYSNKKHLLEFINH